MPHKRRRLRPRSLSAPTAVEMRRTLVRKQWSNESIVSAIKAVKDGMSVMHTVAQFDVPRSTLQDYVTAWTSQAWSKARA